MSFSTMTSRIRRFLRDRKAATAIEYAVIACGIATAIVGAVSVLGVSVAAKWTAVSTAFH